MLDVGPHRGQKAYGGVQDPAQILARMAYRTHCAQNIVERGCCTRRVHYPAFGHGDI